MGNVIDLIHLLTPCQCSCFITYTLVLLVLIIPLRAEGWRQKNLLLVHFGIVLEVDNNLKIHRLVTLALDSLVCFLSVL